MQNSKNEFYLTCEKYYIFELLTFAAGMMGLYTYNLRGGVFCNAQTGNVALMAMAFGKFKFKEGVYYLIPLSAYVAGTIVSEILPVKIRQTHFLRWDTLLVGLEVIVLFFVGLIPLTWPDQIVQVIINFICSMQYNTFRQAEGIPMATTFITNHVRQFGVHIANATRKKDPEAMNKAFKHAKIIFIFFIGGVILTASCKFLQERAIWLAIVPLLLCFIFLIHADLVNEKSKLDQKPHGH